MKKLLVLSLSLMSLLSFASEQCTISIDYQVTSTIDDVTLNNNKVKNKMKRKLRKLLKSKNYREVSFHFPAALYFGSAEYNLKLRANVELTSKGFSWEEFKGESGLEESASASLSNVNELIVEKIIFENSKRKLTKTIFYKNRLDNLLLNAVSQLEDCSKGNNVNSESENIKFGNGTLFNPGAHNKETSRTQKDG